MRFTKVGITLLIASAAVTILAGCAKPTEDPTVKITQIAMTVQAELTQNAALTPSPTATFTATPTPTEVPATPTPSGPTATPTPTIVPTLPAGSIADNSKLVADVTVPDGEVEAAGSKFTKTWRIQNTGSTTWTTDYQLIYLEGVLGTNNVKSVKLTKEVKPGETVDISVSFTAPATDGSYISWWRMYNAAGYLFGEPMYVKFVVGNITATPTP